MFGDGRAQFVEMYQQKEVAMVKTKVSIFAVDTRTVDQLWTFRAIHLNNFENGLEAMNPDDCVLVLLSPWYFHLLDQSGHT